MKKATRTRRQKTRRRAVICLLFLAAILLLHPIPLTPAQALRTTEEQLGLAQTEILVQERFSSATLTLSASEDVLLVTSFHPLPSLSRPSNPLCLIELDPQASPIWIQFLFSNGLDGFRLLGRIDVPGAAAVRVYSNQDSDHAQGVQADLFSGPGGHRYLWATFPRKSQDASDLSDAPHHAEILDRSGQVVAIYDILYSSFFDAL